MREKFNILMQTGIGRRAFLIFMPKVLKNIEYDADIAYEKDMTFYHQCQKINKELKQIFDKIPMNAVYERTEETFKRILHPYIIQITELANNTEDPLLKKEIISRELKAVKLSCLLAALNHPENLFIFKEDMQQAIDIVEMLASDFEKFINDKPKTDDHYDKLWKFFLDNLNKGFTRTELIYEHYNKFGLSRDKFKESFNYYITRKGIQ